MRCARNANPGAESKTGAMIAVLTRRLGLLTLVVVAACSSSGGEARRSPSTRRRAPSTTATTATTAIPATTVTSTPIAAAALVAESDGWRLVLTRPSAGARIGRSVRLCYELSGGTREPVVALMATLRRADSQSSGTTTVDATIGRDSVRVDFAAVLPGAASLEVQLRADGRALDGVRLTVPVEVVSDAPIGDCL